MIDKGARKQAEVQPVCRVCESAILNLKGCRLSPVSALGGAVCALGTTVTLRRRRRVSTSECWVVRSDSACAPDRIEYARQCELKSQKLEMPDACAWRPEAGGRYGAEPGPRAAHREGAAHLHLRQPTFFTELTKFGEAVIRTSGTPALRRLRLLLFQICLLAWRVNK